MKKKLIYPVALLSWGIVYFAALYSMFKNFEGKPALDVNVLTQASLWQGLCLLLYLALFAAFVFFGYKKRLKPLLTATLCQGILIILSVVTILLFILINSDSEILFSAALWILFVILTPFSGLGIPVGSLSLFLLYPILGAFFIVVPAVMLKRIK